MYGISQFGYLVASALFIFALHWMNTPATARRGVYAGVAGTAMAVIVTWAEPSVIHHVWIILAIVAGFIVGVPLSRVPLTAVPQRTALSHAFGGAAAGLARFKELREKFYGGQSYDFSENGLLQIAQRANTANKADDALAYLQANLEYYPKSARTYQLMAQIKNAKGDKRAR